MAIPLSTERVRNFWRELQQLTAERAVTEARLARDKEAEAAAIQRAHQTARQEIVNQQQGERSAADAELAETRSALEAECEAELKSAKGEHAKKREQGLEQYQHNEESAHQGYNEARWTHDAVHEANAKKSKSILDHALRQFAERADAAAALKEQALERHSAWSLTPASPTEAHTDESAGDPLIRMDARLAEAHRLLRRFSGQWAPRVVVGDRWLWICFAAWIAIAASGLLMPHWWYGLIAATIVVPVVGILGRLALAARMRAQARRIGAPLFGAIAEIDRLRSTGDRVAKTAFEHAVAQSKQHQKDETRKSEIEHRKRIAGALAQRDEIVNAADQKWLELSTQIAERRREAIAALEADYRADVDSIEARAAEEIAAVDGGFSKDSADFEAKFAAAERSMIDTWEGGRTRLLYEWQSIAEENDRLFPPWSAIESTAWTPPTSVPGGMRFGSMPVTMTGVAGGQPNDPRLKPFEPDQFAMPALLPFPQRGSTLLHASEAGRMASVQALQAIMLRYLTALPPGKVRFTIIDPVGLGENFASFMHLADHDEQLVTSRIWTEPNQIERRLTDLTAHMENVIQKYLRNQYKSIEEYNAQAGEVAEPYRVLVVANFPTNFSAETARRLVSIANSGAVCGVYVLVSVDSKQALPQGFDLGDLEQACLNLSWGGAGFAWEDADFGPLPLMLDTPPGPTELARIVLNVGERAKQAGKVEVDFSFIEPPAGQRWNADSRKGIRVPLGRAGATKRQHLQLGVGTAQHVLVAGKTGSGKSTLLHALVTNLALHYGPDEIELYLIDFKKGVEFKTYATHALPHARVIAVESEREFGLSVLQRLDAELKWRGDLFRNAGVQDVAAYRDKNPGTVLPRILLVVDEFQEFFVEDDKLSQEAALLLDRLVRQGRAFGLHVLLGSQTLGGAYSLARATIDQMAVRIALQCSEADANLILAKDNNAARLLSRPGEAIYNDANGLVEGNDIFQVVWLPEDRREQYLSDLQSLAKERHWKMPGPTIVFEGNTPADLPGNALLRGLVDAGGAKQPARERLGWLGDALAIKEPTAARFRRQSGSNLLIIGQNGDLARSILAAAGLSVLLQQTPSERGAAKTIAILDGSPSDDPDAGWFGQLASRFCDDVELLSLRPGSTGLSALVEELEIRKGDPGAPFHPRYLIVYGLHRFRDLRKAEDDLGFGRRDESRAASPAEQFAELIREGPAHGIHVLAWCDTLANVQRAIDRRDLREFEQRVLFQMGVTDSSTLIDSPAASRLGLNRALYAAEELSAPEKFRPYRLPADAWLTTVAEQLGAAPRQTPPLEALVAEKSS